MDDRIHHDKEGKSNHVLLFVNIVTIHFADYQTLKKLIAS